MSSGMCLVLASLLYLLLSRVDCFTYSPAGVLKIRSNPSNYRKEMANILYSSTTENDLPEISSMRIKELKEELKNMSVDFSDCFDKDSLMERLTDARTGKVQGTKKEEVKVEKNESVQQAAESSSSFDKEAYAAELREKKVRELRTMCAQNDIRWANMIEKEELVQALVSYQAKAVKFSPSGKILPGKVAQIDDEILEKEVAGGATTPLMLDVYATWCGPCKMMAPLLEEAAAELGNKVRVAKIDSDEYPEWSGKLNVRGLPTVVIFDGKTGKELERVEGALQKEGLLQLARKHL